MFENDCSAFEHILDVMLFRISAILIKGVPPQPQLNSLSLG